MYIGPITWATRDNAYSMTALSLSNQKLAFGYDATFGITALNTPIVGKFFTIGYTNRHPRILMRSYCPFSMPAAPGKTEPRRGFFQFLGSAEVSGADAIPRTIVGAISYAFDDDAHGASLYTSDTLAFIKQ